MIGLQPDIQALPLFPLGSVLFPGGLLGLRIFEVRYLDLMSRCLREGRPFGVVLLTQGSEVRQPGREVGFETIGVLAEMLECDSPGPGLMQVRAKGGRRFLRGPAQQRPNGLWVADATLLPDDDAVSPAAAHADIVLGLQEVLKTFDKEDSPPFQPPWRLDDAGWVANRWCELLPIAPSQKQRLMVMPDPLQRLDAVESLLGRQRGAQH